MIYYNEFDPKAAALLRELIRQGHLPAGDVDERSIQDVRPADLLGYDQCHFFAGIGGWPLALRLAGWPDDRPVWTGSCPCQPFSVAGAGRGTDDPRHLWPAFRWLIDQCRPTAVFGEQVASRAGRDWLSAVRTDLEAMEYGVGAADLCAAGVGAPHIRQRLFWLADRIGTRLEGLAGHECGGNEPGRNIADATGSTAEGGDAFWLADTNTAGQCERSERDGIKAAGQQASRRDDAGGCGEDGGLADTGDGTGFEGQPRTVKRGLPTSYAENSPGISNTDHGGWSDVDWLLCRDGGWRPVEPGTFPLAHGVSARVGRLRGYGNAIVPQLAAAFVRASL